MLFNIFRKKSSLHRRSQEITPDEIFLDARNSADFNPHQMEGMIEQSISKKIIMRVGILCGVIGVIFLVQLFRVQILAGKEYFSQSEQNRLHEITLFGNRGVIYDRHGEALAWNIQSENDEPFSYRAYTPRPGFAHVVGYVGYPKKDSSGIYWRRELQGQLGVESYYDDILAGKPGMRLVETNAKGDVISSGQIVRPVDGENITLSLDAGMQEVLARGLSDMVHQFGYIGGTAMVMNIYTGELLAMTSYPEFNPDVLSRGDDTEIIEDYFSSPYHPMMNRAISGLYTPGSIVKPFVALAALQEKIVTPSTKIMSTGYIEIPNPYNPENPSRFYDWRWGRNKTGHGATDVYHAIADSVNTYFYVVGGGYQGRPGLGIARIKQYLEKFEIGKPTGFTLGTEEKTGIIPDPEWKKKSFAQGTWRVGDTYNTVIGQFGFQVTPLQMLRAVSGIASRGILVTPHILKDQDTERKKIQGIDDGWYTVVQDAMRETVTKGTAQILNINGVSVAVKSGTAQTRGNKKINAWIEGFFPYENPQYAFVIMSEGASSDQRTGSSYVAFKLFDWIRTHSTSYMTQD